MGNRIIKTTHSSKSKAFHSLMKKTVGALVIYITVPGGQTLVMHTEGTGWTVESAYLEK